MNDEQAVGIIKEVAEIGTQTIRKEKLLKKNWRFTAACLTVLLCVTVISAAVYGIVCHTQTIAELRREHEAVIEYFENLVIETETTTEYEYDATAETDESGNAKAIAKGGGS